MSQEFRLTAVPGAVMSHWINLTDIFSAFDPGITPFYFLRFSGLAVALAEQSDHSVNRLRVSEYRRCVPRERLSNR